MAGVVQGVGELPGQAGALEDGKHEGVGPAVLPGAVCSGTASCSKTAFPSSS